MHYLGGLVVMGFGILNPQLILIVCAAVGDVIGSDGVVGWGLGQKATCLAL